MAFGVGGRGAVGGISWYNKAECKSCDVNPPCHSRAVRQLIITLCVCVCVSLRFNMPHDDNPKCREAGMKHPYHVMAPTLNYDTNPWSWSKCSRKYITEFLE